MAKQDLSDLQADKKNYDQDSQNLIDSLVFEKDEIALINNMKQSEGWKLLERRIKEELRERISSLVKDDPRVQTLLSLLEVSATKKRTRVLEKEIEKILPE